MKMKMNSKDFRLREGDKVSQGGFETPAPFGLGHHSAETCHRKKATNRAEDSEMVCPAGSLDNASSGSIPQPGADARLFRSSATRPSRRQGEQRSLRLHDETLVLLS
jgi:hypothetical protein